jgi:hypothetical protein
MHQCSSVILVTHVNVNRSQKYVPPAPMPGTILHPVQSVFDPTAGHAGFWWAGGTGVGFLGVLWFPLPILIPSTSTHSLNHPIINDV